MLQQALNKAGAAVKEDSEYGASTQAAVRAFQTDHALPATGSVDAATWTAIRSGARSPTSAAPGLYSTESWPAMSAQNRADWTTLGYTTATWKSKTAPLIVLAPHWFHTSAQRAAATRLGFTRASRMANQDRTAGAAAAAYAGEEKAVKKKAGAGVLPAKFVGSLRAKAMLDAEFAGDVAMQLPKVHLLTAAQMKTAWENIYGVGTYSPVNRWRSAAPDGTIHPYAVASK
jgi:hypothetical protein